MNLKKFILRIVRATCFYDIIKLHEIILIYDISYNFN